MREEVMQTLGEWYPKYLADRHVVLELGSREVYGGVPRGLFGNGHEYTGVDMLAGQGVDVVLNFHSLGQLFKKSHADAVLCLETLEHDDCFWLTLSQVRQVLKRGGTFVCSVPSLGFPTYHPNPKDYYRFTKDAVEDVIFDGYEILELKELYTGEQSDGLIGIGRRQ